MTDKIFSHIFASTAELRQIIEDWAERLSNGDRSAIEISSEEFNALMRAFHPLTDNLQAVKEYNEIGTIRLSQCLEFISGLAQLDFNQKPLEVFCDQGTLDGIFTGLNMLAEELNSSVVSRDLLEAKNTIMESLIENIPSAIFLKSIDDDFRVQIWNKAAERIFLVPREKILGKFTQEVFS